MVIGIDELNNNHIDILREIGNIGAGNAATALAKMLNKKIEMSVPKVNILGFKEIPDILGRGDIPVVGILISIEGDLTGNIIFVLTQESARILVNILMGRQEMSVPEDEKFDEIEISALKEVGNILSSSYLTAISTLTNLKVLAGIPDLCIDMAGAILSVPAIGFGSIGESVLYIETQFFDGVDRVVGEFFLVPSADCYEILLRALGVIS